MPDTRPDPLDDVMICPTCGHRAEAHSRGGMCDGRPSVCHCSRMAPIDDAIEFRPWMAHHAGVTLTQPQPDAGLREAAQAVVDDWFGTYDPEVRIPSAAENIEALRAALQPDTARWYGVLEQVHLAQIVHEALGYTDDYHGEPNCGIVAERIAAALRSTPAAPEPEWRHYIDGVEAFPEDATQPDAGSRTECSLAGVHAHSFQGPHTFHEWEPGTTPAPRDTALREALAAWLASHGDYRDSRDGIPSAYPEGWNDALNAVSDFLALASPAPTAAPGLREALEQVRREVAAWGLTFPDGTPRQPLSTSRVARSDVLAIIDEAIDAAIRSTPATPKEDDR